MKKTSFVPLSLYLLVMVWLCSRISGPAEVSYRLYEEFFEQRSREVQTDIARAQSAINEPTSDTERVSGYRARALQLADASNHVLLYLESCKSHIEWIKSQFPRDGNDTRNKKVNQFFISQHIADSIEIKIKTLLELSYWAMPHDSNWMHHLDNSLWDNFRPLSGDGNHWAQSLLRDQSQSGNLAILSMMGYNVRTSEFRMLKRLGEIVQSALHGGCNFDPGAGIAVPSGKSILPGDTARAAIMLVQVNNPYHAAFRANTGKCKQVDTRYAIWTGAAQAPGLYRVNGTTTLYHFRNQDSLTFPWSFQYLVVKKNAGLSLHDSYCLYADVPNPITIQVPGYPPTRLRLKVPGARVQQTEPGKYLISVLPGSKGLLKASIVASEPYGSTNTLLTHYLRIQELPPLYGSLGQQGKDTMALGEIRAQTGIRVGTFDNDWDVTNLVTGFDLSILKNGHRLIGPLTCHGPLFASCAAAQQEIKQLQTGDKLMISDIKVQPSPGKALPVSPVIVVAE